MRVERLSDGDSVEVSANHRLIAAIDRELVPDPAPESVAQWSSRLSHGPDGTLGEWQSSGADGRASLKAVPFIIPDGRTIFALGMGVSCGEQSPVLLQSASTIRVQGRVTSSRDLFVGVTVRHSDGEFAGRFQVVRPAAEFEDGEEFEVLLSLEEFGLDPGLDDVRDKLPASPVGLVVESVWCHTLFDSVGLEVTEAEILSVDPEDSVIAAAATARVPSFLPTDPSSRLHSSCLPSAMIYLRRGFTLIELLVVIAIIGILVALLLPGSQAEQLAVLSAEITCTRSVWRRITTTMSPIVPAVLHSSDRGSFAHRRCRQGTELARIPPALRRPGTALQSVGLRYSSQPEFGTLSGDRCRPVSIGSPFLAATLRLRRRRLGSRQLRHECFSLCAWNGGSTRRGRWNRWLQLRGADGPAY